MSERQVFYLPDSIEMWMVFKVNSLMSSLRTSNHQWLLPAEPILVSYILTHCSKEPQKKDSRLAPVFHGAYSKGDLIKHHLDVS